MQVAVIVLASLGCLYWLITLVMSLVAVRKVPLLSRLGRQDPERWPLLSAIVPARDEEGTIERSLLALLGSDYPALEVVAVDDRSGDGTGAIVDRLAAEDPRLRALHISEPPEGWLGKVHAMQRGREAATGEWLLFADADVELAPGALRAAVALCEADGVDFLTAIPRLLPASPLVDAAIASMARTVFVGGQIWKLADPRSGRGGGFGAFLLARAAVLDRTPGLEWLRLEVADDIGLGLLMKRGGARCLAVNARDEMSLCFYPSFRALRGGVEKGGFAIVGRFSLGRTLLLGALMPLLELASLAGFVPMGSILPLLLGGAGLLLGLLSSTIVARWARTPLRALPLFLLGGVISSLLVARSGLLGWRRGGVSWRGTFYPTELLRSGRRVDWP